MNLVFLIGGGLNISVPPLTLFRFKRANTFIHKLDPRSKILLVFSLSVVAFILRGQMLPSFLLLVLVITLTAAAKALTEWLKAVKGLAILIAIILILNWLTIGLEYAISMVLLFVTLMSAFAILFLTTNPDDFTQALIKLKVPFEVAFELSMAVRFVPTLLREAQIITDAQKARGLELEKGAPWRRLRNLVPIMVPLVVNTFRRAYQVAEAMESRAFGAIKTRTFIKQLRFSVHDWLVTMCSILMICVVAYTQCL
ncbi:MAG: energy-coupling factor transporter transmembrane component T [Candidatus Nezhaarchaeales archaeon]